MSIKIIELGTFEKVTINNKWLVKAKKDQDYTKNDPLGSFIIDEKGNKVGKVLDIIGNINNPYALILPLTDQIPQGKLYVQLQVRERKRKPHRR